MNNREMIEAEKLKQARDLVVDSMGRTFCLYGMPNVIGRIYGLLYFTEQSIGLDEIAAEFGVSKG